MTHPRFYISPVRKVTSSIIFVILGSLAAIIIHYNYSQVSDLDAAYINLAGRQRMLSLKILVFSNQYYLGKINKPDVLLETVNEFDQSLRTLEYDGRTLGYEINHAPKEVRDPLSKVRELWSLFKQEVFRLTSPSSTNQQRSKAHQYILKEVTNLTALSNEVVIAYEKYIERKQHRTLYFLLTISLLIFIAIALGLWLLKKFIILKKSVELSLTRQVKQSEEAELAIQKSKQRLHAIINHAADGIITANKCGLILTVNAAALKIFGYRKHELIGEKISKLLTGACKDNQDPYTDMINNTDESRIFNQVHTEFLTMRADGSHIHIELSVSEVKSKDQHQFIVLCRDISERKKYEEQLQHLTQHLHDVREEEQKRIARELHDELGQSLTALTLDASWMISRIPPESLDCKQRLKSMIKLIDNTVQSVRRLTAELRPPILDHFGLDSALRWYAEDFESRNEIQCHLTVSDEVQSLAENQSIATFRIFQETLTNVTRHANASEVIINLIIQNQHLYMDIKDNGTGFNIDDKAILRKRFGIMGMKERAMALNGKVEIASEPGNGTVVTLSFPVERESNRIDGDNNIRIVSG